MNKLHIPVYSLDWHINQSPSQDILLIEPLSPYMKFNKIGWDGKAIPDIKKSDFRNSPIVFYQLPPPEEICKIQNAKIIWIPMWDHARAFDIKWWEQLPKNIRIVSFSNEISKRSRAAGLDTLDVRFFMNPGSYIEADFNKPRTLLYWNRAGLVGIKFLSKLCKTLNVEQLFFRRGLDPGRKEIYDYKLPDKIGKTIVKELAFNFERNEGRDEYLHYLDQANIFIAPRTVEGVGLTFIEAMVRGCSVFAFNAPTMNEYISHKSNGYLVDRCDQQFINRSRANMEKTIFRVNRKFDFPGNQFDFPITEWQDWGEMEGLDLKTMGIHARHDQKIGYQGMEEYSAKICQFHL